MRRGRTRSTGERGRRTEQNDLVEVDRLSPRKLNPASDSSLVRRPLLRRNTAKVCLQTSDDAVDSSRRREGPGCVAVVGRDLDGRPAGEVRRGEGGGVPGDPIAEKGKLVAKRDQDKEDVDIRR